MKIAAFLALSLLALATSTARSQGTDPSSKLDVWIGRWAYHAQDLETPYSHAHTYDGTSDCNWSANHGFMVCDFLNKNSPPGFPKNDLGIFCYDPIKREFSRVGVFKESQPVPQRVAIDGNTWITSTEIPYKGKTAIYRTVYVFESNVKRTTTSQISIDKGKTWTIVERFTAEKVST